MKTAADILAQTPGLTYRQLDHWTRLGHVRVKEVSTPIIGVPREYADTEARVVSLIHRLVCAGVCLGVAAQVARDVAAGSHLPGVTPGYDLAPGIRIVIGVAG